MSDLGLKNKQVLGLIKIAVNTVVRELEVTEYSCGQEKNAVRDHR